jgi:hypothetical protein
MKTERLRRFGFLSGKKPWGRRVAKANRRRNDWSGVRQKTRLGRSWQHSQRFQYAHAVFSANRATNEGGRRVYSRRPTLLLCKAVPGRLWGSASKERRRRKWPYG